MSAVSSTGTGVANTAATATASPNAFSSLSSEQFVKIIFSELSNQDPLQPSDSNALLQQLANLRNIQSGMDLSDKLSSLVTQNQLASASGLIGKSVSGVDPTGLRQSGVVQSVLRTSDGAVLQLPNGVVLNMNNVDQIDTLASGRSGAGFGPVTKLGGHRQPPAFGSNG